MSAADVIQNLLTLGVEVKNAATKSGQSVDSFLNSSDFQTIQESVTTLLASLQRDDLQNALEAVQQKEASLRKGRPLSALSADELTQFHALLDAESALVDKLIASRPNAPSFLSILANQVLPILVPIAKTVISLLL